MSLITFFKGYKNFGLAFSILSIIIMIIIFNVLNVEKPLPIYQPNMVSEELVDSSVQYKRKYHKIDDFSFVNQNSQIITQDTYKNKIYVADFFFTTCPSICPIMTNHMYAIQRKIIEDDEVMLLSHSVTPKIDSVAQLKKYALENGIIDKKWNLVTGDKKQIYELARKSYLAVKTDGNGDEFDMIHTENFMLIDKQRQIRGSYDGTNPDDIERLLEDIKILKKES